MDPKTPSRKSNYVIPSLPKTKSTPLRTQQKITMRSSRIQTTPVLSTRPRLPTKETTTTLHSNKDDHDSQLPFDKVTSPERVVQHRSDAGLSICDIINLTTAKKKALSSSSNDNSTSRTKLEGVRKQLIMNNTKEMNETAMNALLSIFDHEHDILSKLSYATRDENKNGTFCTSVGCSANDKLKRITIEKLARTMENTTREHINSLPQQYGEDLKKCALFWITKSRFEYLHGYNHEAIQFLEEGKQYIMKEMVGSNIEKIYGHKQLKMLDEAKARMSICIKSGSCYQKHDEEKGKANVKSKHREIDGKKNALEIRDNNKLKLQSEQEPIIGTPNKRSTRTPSSKDKRDRNDAIVDNLFGSFTEMTICGKENSNPLTLET